MGLKPRIRTTAAAPRPGPQSNQRGIETPDRDEILRRVADGPQSNQRGIETEWLRGAVLAWK